MATIVFMVLIAVIVVFLFYFEREKPEVVIKGEPGLVSLEQDYTLSLADHKSGLRHAEVKVVQNDLEKLIKEKNFQRQSSLPSAGTERWQTNISLDIEKLGLKDGPAELIIEVSDFSLWSFFRGNLTRKVYSLTVDTEPPKVSRLASSRHMKPGGSGIAVYSVKGESVSHGIRLNGYFHPGCPLPGKKKRYAAIVGLPFNTEKIQDLWIEARDEAGNISKARFGMSLKDVVERHDRINISDNFLDWKIPEFSSYLKGVSGDQLDKFLYINDEVRDRNNSKIKHICEDSADERYWEGRFLRMPGKKMSGYADRRTYYYGDQEIDNQVHLGIDLASYRHADVDAANNGKVIFSGYLGIYGNTVIVDHGLGVFSLYAHLSNILVSRGDLVNKGEKIGITGTTGMAGGDHLHFSMLVNGIFVDPVEWWDQHWIEVSIMDFLR
ncbi:MAG: M23 family metallopeptidase [Desulfobia sp.]